MKTKMNYQILFRTPNHDNTELQTIAAFDAPDYRSASFTARMDSIKLPFIYKSCPCDREHKIVEVAVLGYTGSGETYQRQFVEAYEGGKNCGRVRINNESKCW